MATTPAPFHSTNPIRSGTAACAGVPPIATRPVPVSTVAAAATAARRHLGTAMTEPSSFRGTDPIMHTWKIIDRCVGSRSVRGTPGGRHCARLCAVAARRTVHDLLAAARARYTRLTPAGAHAAMTERVVLV